MSVETHLLSAISDPVGVHISARRRHDPRRPYSHFAQGWGELTAKVQKALSAGRYQNGLAPGSFVVVLPPDGFFQAEFQSKVNHKQLQEDDKHRDKLLDLAENLVKFPAREPVQVVVYTKEAIRNAGRRPSNNTCLLEVVSIRA
jgi:hypothetical protein